VTNGESPGLNRLVSSFYGSAATRQSRYLHDYALSQKNPFGASRMDFFYAPNITTTLRRVELLLDHDFAG